MSIKTKKKIIKRNLKIKSLKGGSSLRIQNNLEDSAIDTFNDSPVSETNESSDLVIEENIEKGNFDNLEESANNDEGEYFFEEDELSIKLQPYGDEASVVLDNGESIYGLNMNVISFDSTIKETKSFSPRAKFLGEETLIKKYYAKGKGRIIFDYDKNDPSSYVKQQIVLVSLNRDMDNFIVRNPENIIAYTGNISIHVKFKFTALRSSKEKVIFTNLKLSKNSERGYIWVVLDTFDVKEELNNSIKIKNESFLCATMPKNGFKLHKLIASSLRLTKSTKEYVEILPPCTVYRKTNNFSNKQLTFMEKYRTNIF